MIHNSLFIIIPVHNRKKFTEECLFSIRKQTFDNFKVIVIDDGSTDGTEEMINKEFPEVILLKGNGNFWWTKATNLGVKYALENGAEYVLTLNDDTILADNYIEKMIYWASIKKDVLLGSFAVDFKTLQPIYGGEIINWKKANSEYLLNIVAPDKFKGLHKVTHYLGRGLLIPSNVFEKIGLFNEKNFPHYLADFDFTHRAVRHGFNIYCNYDAKLFVFSEESGDYQNKKKKSFNNYLSHLFGRKGGGNLKSYVIFSIKNCPPKYLFNFLIIGLIRRIFGYLYYWFLEVIQTKRFSNKS